MSEIWLHIQGSLVPEMKQEGQVYSSPQGRGLKGVGWLKRRSVDVLFSIRVENEENDVLFDGGNAVFLSGRKNWEPVGWTATLLVKNLAKLFPVRKVDGGVEVI